MTHDALLVSLWVGCLLVAYFVGVLSGMASVFGEWRRADEGHEALKRQSEEG
ncbi:MAG TPA: hypothetical protein VEI97_14585 [bacterium]|nr:hypothetical protein [bacterium]